MNDKAIKLRELCASMRSKPYPISDIIPSLQIAADEIDWLETRLEACEDVLRELASYLGVGGYNAPTVDPRVFKSKIIEGIEMQMKYMRELP